MKKILLTIFIAACFAVCLLPSLGMIASPTSKPIGNERETKLPSLTKPDGSLNTSYPTQLGNYFEKHFAFRSLAISTDAKIQSSVFSTSNNDSVITGSDGWLYYQSTLDNYLGSNVFSTRKAKAVVQNLELVQSFCESRGVNFLFTIAPNKNSLYPGHMPYYYNQKVSAASNRDKVSAALANSAVPYCDLYALFNGTKEVLYFARDSHWNNKGALMVYNEIMTMLGKAHDDYSTAPVVRKKDFVGDLAKMLYPSGSEPEYNTYYGTEKQYRYVTDTKTVEESYIKTENENATGSLYMYRDSFGNALLPFFASAYQNATFTKSFPMLLENDIEAQKPDTFIMELVERNLDWLCTRPPILTAPEMSYLKTDGTLSGKVNAQTSPCEFAPAYTQISGEAQCDALTDDAEFYVSVTDKQGKSTVYQAYNICTDKSDYGFQLYVPAEALPAGSESEIKLIVKNNDGYYEIGG